MQLLYSKPGTRPALAPLDQAYLREIVAELSFPRVMGTPANVRAEAIVAREFERNLGGFQITGDTRNVTFGAPQTARILIGAHYDSVPSTPGADDNASAVAVLLGVAKMLGPGSDVMFVAFNGEEVGLVGSHEFVHQSQQHLTKLEQVHVLEMVGYRSRQPNSQRNPLPLGQVPTVGDFLGLAGNRLEDVERIIHEAGGIDVPVVGVASPPGMPVAMIRQFSPHLLRSDHGPFWEMGFPAVMWTDTAEFRNPHYHQPTDTPETLDYEFMAAIGGLLAGVVRAKQVA